jgi:putative DNA primase/helicase
MTGIPFMVTQAMKAALHARGLPDEAIAELKPEQAHEILARPDKREVREFIETILAQARAATKDLPQPGLLQMLLVQPLDESVVIYRYALDDSDLVQRMTSDAINASDAGHNVYVEGRTVRRGLGAKERGKLEDTVAVFALVVDSDADKGAAWSPTVPTSLAVETSPGNMHAWFFLERAVDAPTGQAQGERLRAATHADADTGNVCQPYRVAGTVNYPGKKKRERGRIVTWTRSLGFDPETLWTPERFAQEFPATAPKTNGQANGAADADESTIPTETLDAIKDTSAGKRGGRLWNILMVLKECGFTIDGIVALLERYPDGVAAKYRGRLRREVERVWDKLANQPAPNAKHEVALRPGCDVEMKSIDWLWSNHLARGKLTLLSGPSELGKSTIAIDLAARLSRGGEWPDGDPAPLASAIIISSEDAIDDTIVPRLAAADADLARVYMLAFAKTDGITRTFSLQTDLDRLGEKMQAIGDVGLVIIDPVTSYMGSKLDSHHTVEVRAVLEPLQKFAERYNVAVLMISHPQKAAATNVLNAVTGSAAFVHAPRMTFIVITDPENPDRTLFLAGKNNIGRKAEGMGYNTVSAFVGPDESILTSRVAWDNQPVRITANQALEAAAEKKKGTAGAEAEEFLRTRLGGDGCSSKDIQDEAEALGISERTLYRARKKLGVRAEKDSYAEGWRLFLDQQNPGWRKRAGGDD